MQKSRTIRDLIDYLNNDRYFKIDEDIVNKTNINNFDEFFEYIDFITEHCGFDMNNGLEAFIQISHEFILLQSRFLKSKRYSSTNFSSVNHKIYQNEDYMKSIYLDGLLLTYVLWLNHKKVYDYFLEFLNAQNLKSIHSCVEFGVGHGLMTYSLLKRFPNINYTGIDISTASLKFAQQRISAIFPNSILSFSRADATSKNLIKSLNKIDLIMCCEILEHVEDPNQILRNIQQMLSGAGLCFVTTVINLEAIDHIFLFESIEHLESYFHKNGFKIVKSLVLEVQNFSNDSILQANYACVLQKEENF